MRRTLAVSNVKRKAGSLSDWHEGTHVLKALLPHAARPPALQQCGANQYCTNGACADCTGNW